jgi:5-methylcytosine-specific restriction protein A
MTSHVLKTGDIARELGCAPRTVSKMIDSGDLAGWRIGNNRRVHAEVFDEFCRQRGIPIGATRPWHVDELGALAVRGLRDPHWPSVERAHLKLFPTCAACGSKKLLNVHHILPFHLWPELELVEKNLITLCESPAHNCHLIFGHLLNWASWNTDVVAEAAAYLQKVLDRPTTRPPAAQAAAA